MVFKPLIVNEVAPKEILQYSTHVVAVDELLPFVKKCLSFLGQDQNFFVLHKRTWSKLA
ncbi:unnamed protein product [Dovyalis caffra]|uniref:Uncharacterized protein n=1 Tax=Dovyalis caffra TaxID=77055 RepID=A0AAV1R3V4_9ROSI|nr:unnamed protein product [Dovyalis caffra]